MEKIIVPKKLGATFTDEGTEFLLWAPKARKVDVVITTGTQTGRWEMVPEENGYFSAVISGVVPGDRYLYAPEEREARPDPASRYQPQGVHHPSQVVSPARLERQERDWHGIPLGDYIIYELHVGTFSREGTFAGVIPHLDYLKALGITAVEIMPVAQFAGSRNWGYDGVYQYAPQSSYGGPEGLKNLVDACHAKGLAVILDVVYNHFGPEGNYLSDFGYYFTNHYRTPWGDAINYDGPYSDEVRRFFLENAVYWLTEFHFDALRLDAIDKIFDYGARHFLQELAETVHGLRQRLNRQIYLIAESDLNDPRLINPPEKGGYGVDAQWNDGFHHIVHTLLTGEKNGYYEDYAKFSQLAKAFAENYVFTGEYSSYRKRRHGNSVSDRPPSQFVVFSQNHDQVGNRHLGDRLSTLLPLEKLMLAAGTVLLSPFIPLLFMGEEYGEKAPFNYFVDYTDQELIRAVRRGRREEFSAFAWEGEAPDPQDQTAFFQTKIDLELREKGEHRFLFNFYRQLIRLRKTIPAFRTFDRRMMTINSFDDARVIVLTRQKEASAAAVAFNFSPQLQKVRLPFPSGVWDRVLDSSSSCWGGAGELSPPEFAGNTPVGIKLNPYSLVVYQRREEQRSADSV